MIADLCFGEQPRVGNIEAIIRLFRTQGVDLDNMKVFARQKPRYFDVGLKEVRVFHTPYELSIHRDWYVCADDALAYVRDSDPSWDLRRDGTTVHMKNDSVYARLTYPHEGNFRNHNIKRDIGVGIVGVGLSLPLWQINPYLGGAATLLSSGALLHGLKDVISPPEYLFQLRFVGSDENFAGFLRNNKWNVKAYK